MSDKANFALIAVRGIDDDLARVTAERDELRRVLERCLMYGQLPIAIADEARKLLEARP